MNYADWLDKGHDYKAEPCWSCGDTQDSGARRGECCHCGAPERTQLVAPRLACLPGREDALLVVAA